MINKRGQFFSSNPTTIEATLTHYSRGKLAEVHSGVITISLGLQGHPEATQDTIKYDGNEAAPPYYPQAHRHPPTVVSCAQTAFSLCHCVGRKRTWSSSNLTLVLTLSN